MLGALERVHAFHPDRGPARPLDARAHLQEQLRQVDDLGLLGRVADHGLAVGQGGGHHHVLGAGHGDGVEVDLDPAEALGGGLDVPGLHADAGPHLLQGLEVEVDGPVADGAPAGQRDAGLARARHQGTQHEHRGPHGLDQVVGGLDGGELPGLDLDDAADPELDLRAHVGEEPPHGADVPHLGDIGEHDGLVREEGRADVGQGGVLGPRDAHRALQGPAPHDTDTLHGISLRPVGGRNM